MGKRIITIGRQTGSGGHEIAELLAEKLNLPLHDRNVVEEAVKELQLDDADEWDEKVFVDHISNFAKGYYAIFGKGKLYHMMDHSKEEECSISMKMYETESGIIQKFAEIEPCIIIGRCADFVLQDREDVLSVFIYADEVHRTERMMKRRNLSYARAVNVMELTDKERAKYYKFCTKQKWGAPENYDLMLNSSLLGIDGVVDVLAKLYDGENSSVNDESSNIQS